MARTTAPDTDPAVDRAVQRFTPAPGWHRPVLVSLAVAAISVILAGVGLWMHGERWFSVATPSMGTTAPVGTFVMTTPVRLAELHVGDVIAFVPPTERSVTFTHRIITITPAGLTTRGDINGATDPWTLTQHDLIGRAVVIAPGFGYLLRALPLMIIGGLVVWSFTRLWVRPSRRGPARMAGVAAIYVLCAVTIRPFLGVLQLVTTTDPDGTAHISAVSTGILPIRLAAAPGHGDVKPLDLSYGGTGVIHLHTRGGGRLDVAAHLHLTLWQWVGLILVWSLPVLWVLAVGLRPLQPEPQVDPTPHEGVDTTGDGDTGPDLLLAGAPA